MVCIELSPIERSRRFATVSSAQLEGPLSLGEVLEFADEGGALWEGVVVGIVVGRLSNHYELRIRPLELLDKSVIHYN